MCSGVTLDLAESSVSLSAEPEENLTFCTFSSLRPAGDVHLRPLCFLQMVRLTAPLSRLSQS